MTAASGLRQCDLNDLSQPVEWMLNARRIEVESKLNRIRIVVVTTALDHCSALVCLHDGSIQFSIHADTVNDPAPHTFLLSFTVGHLRRLSFQFPFCRIQDVDPSLVFATPSQAQTPVAMGVQKFSYTTTRFYKTSPTGFSTVYGTRITG